MEGRARTVLHVCPDRALAGSRRRVVTAIGYDVVWVQSESAALFEISMGRCGILLLCHLLPEAVRASLTDYFHTQCPDPLYRGGCGSRSGNPSATRARARDLFTRSRRAGGRLAAASGSLALPAAESSPPVNTDACSALLPQARSFL
jgi:hypothetical protein